MPSERPAGVRLLKVEKEAGEREGRLKKPLNLLAVLKKVLWFVSLVVRLFGGIDKFWDWLKDFF